MKLLFLFLAMMAASPWPVAPDAFSIGPQFRNQPPFDRLAQFPLD